jgi:serine protease Do
VKYSSPIIASIALMFGSLTLGIVAASFLRGDLIDAPESLAVSDLLSDEVDTNGIDVAGAFIQDPPQRTSLRPDFSSGLRRSNNQRGNFFMLRAFHDAIGESWKSTVRISHDGNQVALGAVVGSDGWVISKASELPSSGDVVCRLYNGEDCSATVVTQVQELDLALIQVDRRGLVPVSWHDSDIPPRGSWLATTDAAASVPAAVGVVSAGALAVNKSNAVLGVHLADSIEGAAVTMVLRGSGAEAAGLQIGDSIFRVNDQDVRSRENFLSALRNGIGGQVVKLSVNRAERRFETEGRLMDLADELLDETEMEVNGRVSARSTGFGRVFMHDTVLKPNQCGGPVVGLDGKVVGINIARAGRVSSYALPVDVVKPVVEGLIDQAKLVSKPFETQSNQRPIR